MAVSEQYVIDYLLRETGAGPANLEWQEGESGGYTATFNLVRLQMYSVQSLGGPRLCLEFGWEHDTIFIQEPCKVAMFGRQYRNEDDERVAELLHRLHGAVAQQVRWRREKAMEMEAEIRESIFRRLLFGPPAGAGLDAGG